MEKKQPLAKLTRKERRKKFNRWISKSMLNDCPGFGKVRGFGERKPLICDICGKQVSKIKMGEDGVSQCSNCY